MIERIRPESNERKLFLKLTPLIPGDDFLRKCICRIIVDFPCKLRIIITRVWDKKGLPHFVDSFNLIFLRGDDAERRGICPGAKAGRVLVPVRAPSPQVRVPMVPSW